VSINIKNKEAERLLAEIKQKTGRGTTDLLLDLLRRERARLDEDLERRVSRGFRGGRANASFLERPPPGASTRDR
jgi:hypothetical protein